jgi:hypothetical protein
MKCVKKVRLTKQFLPWLQNTCEAKVSKLYIEVIIQQNVLWLQVTMHNVVTMHVVQGLEQLSHDVPVSLNMMK